MTLLFCCRPEKDTNRNNTVTLKYEANEGRKKDKRKKTIYYPQRERLFILDYHTKTETKHTLEEDGWLLLQENLHLSRQ